MSTAGLAMSDLAATVGFELPDGGSVVGLAASDVASGAFCAAATPCISATSRTSARTFMGGLRMAGFSQGRLIRCRVWMKVQPGAGQWALHHLDPRPDPCLWNGPVTP